MKKINFKDKRIIKNKDFKINPGQIYLDPLTLNINKNEENIPLYLSNLYFNENKKLLNYKIDKPNNYDISKNMFTPSLLINTNDLLNLYNINYVDDLIEFVNNNINEKYFDFINRIINCWIRQNFNEIKNKNYFLIDIYVKLFKNYFNINNKLLYEQINLYIVKWFKTKKFDDFNLNLGDNLIKYLANKYES
jgi:hypothetical protein